MLVRAWFGRDKVGNEISDEGRVQRKTVEVGKLLFYPWDLYRFFFVLGGKGDVMGFPLKLKKQRFGGSRTVLKMVCRAISGNLRDYFLVCFKTNQENQNKIMVDTESY